MSKKKSFADMSPVVTEVRLPMDPAALAAQAAKVDALSSLAPDTYVPPVTGEVPPVSEKADETAPTPAPGPDHRLTLRVPEALWEQLRKYSFDNKTSSQAVVLALVTEFFNK